MNRSYNLKEGSFQGRYPLDLVLMVGHGEYNIVIESYIGIPKIGRKIKVYQKGENSTEHIIRHSEFKKHKSKGYKQRTFEVLGHNPNIFLYQFKGDFLDSMFLEVEEIPLEEQKWK